MFRISSGVSAAAKRYHCGLLVLKSRAWTKDNPRRGFLGCPDYDAERGRRGGKYFRYVDTKDPTTWQTEVILRLLQEKQELNNEVMTIRKESRQSKQHARKIESDYLMLNMRRVALNLGLNCDIVLVCVALCWYALRKRYK